MNALFELLGSTILKEQYQELIKMGTTFGDYDVTFTTHRNREIVNLLPKWGSTPVKEWFKIINFAAISGPGAKASLPSKRDEEDEKNFYDILASIDYNNGYGSQELFGVIAFKDGSWLERYEYDGSEKWIKCSYPHEENYIKEQD